ncbi:MAG TPA: DNA-binding protein [Ktedonobacter sp.]|nr:DNA-binding protein [Ktedonobacter sp.]HBE26824.1 DNA-binding protein [Ktedonobacter sp.]HCF85840.1 DNA-binding protein [Ktedonobacter sp.]HCP75753.1 DNA-binding protein [Ktedonobacter sp.]
MSEERLYTIKECAAMLKVSTDTIRRMIRRGELETTRVGVQIRIRASSLEKYL